MNYVKIVIWLLHVLSIAAISLHLHTKDNMMGVDRNQKLRNRLIHTLDRFDKMKSGTYSLVDDR
jgi:hypothetical protein